MKKHLFYLAGILLVIAGCKNSPTNDVEQYNGSIYGRVTDFATGSPVYAANVQLHPTGETTLTGSDGLYEFIDIKDGDYSIIVSKAEYGVF